MNFALVNNDTQDVLRVHSDAHALRALAEYMNSMPPQGRYRVTPVDRHNMREPLYTRACNCLREQEQREHDITQMRTLGAQKLSAMPTP